ncbi:hypothetical protein DERF_013694 [Dermatophagoides farinae]|uniref:Uncharacterized protein n=1 Tax=Dermatophagoides farinae TaxID=6954 RepID=A0A922L0U0_DERFA|nr:hypothetical protein DERF_013694 [Dermatophagoides farinae]
MIIFNDNFKNYSNESICLKVEKISHENQHCKLTITRKCDRFWHIFLIILFMFILVILLLFQRQNLTFTLFTILVISFSILMYIFLPIVEESIILFDNFHGIEYGKKYLFHKSTVRMFINTNNVIINEAITMQKVIFYLIAIPADLGHLVLHNNNNNNNSDEAGQSNHPLNNINDQTKIFNETKIKLIPLFIHTLPRLDCLKIVYNYIIQFRNQQQQQQM